jgi:hypothetical protein
MKALEKRRTRPWYVATNFPFSGLVAGGITLPVVTMEIVQQSRSGVAVLEVEDAPFCLSPSLQQAVREAWETKRAALVCAACHHLTPYSRVWPHCSHLVCLKCSWFAFREEPPLQGSCPAPGCIATDSARSGDRWEDWAQISLKAGSEIHRRLLWEDVKWQDPFDSWACPLCLCVERSLTAIWGHECPAEWIARIRPTDPLSVAAVSLSSPLSWSSENASLALERAWMSANLMTCSQCGGASALVSRKQPCQHWVCMLCLLPEHSLPFLFHLSPLGKLPCPQCQTEGTWALPYCPSMTGAIQKSLALARRAIQEVLLWELVQLSWNLVTIIGDYTLELGHLHVFRPPTLR